jgi:hypothetical protein
MPSVTAPPEILRTSGASTKRRPARVLTMSPSKPESGSNSTRFTGPTGWPKRSMTGVPGSKVRNDVGCGWASLTDPVSEQGPDD